jgi:hypothetical protein
MLLYDPKDGNYISGLEDLMLTLFSPCLYHVKSIILPKREQIPKYSPRIGTVQYRPTNALPLLSVLAGISVII